MISATHFGLLFIPALALVLILRHRWLPAMIVVSAVLQAPAPLIAKIGDQSYGITPFNLAMAAAALAMARGGLVGWRKQIEFATSGVGAPWVAYLMFAVMASLTLPLVFSHIPVHSLLAVGDVKPEPGTNNFSISHVAQSINHAGLLVVMVYLLGQERPEVVVRSMVVGLGAALSISLLAGMYQRGVFLGIYETDFSYWASNPSYNQYFHAPEYGPDFGRVGLPFIEPSYASVWFAGMCGGITMLAVYGKSTFYLWVIPLLMLTGLGLINTVGTSGFVAIAAFLPLLVFRHAVKPQVRFPRSNRLVAGLMVIAAIMASIVIADYACLKSDFASPLRSAVDFTIEKTADIESVPRFFTTMHALKVFLESYGIGVGPGSTRTSGYLVSLLAHLGVGGLALLSWAAVRTLRVLESAECQPTVLLAVGMAYAGGLGLAVGVGDLAWPVAWVWIFFAACVARAVATSDGGGRRGKLASLAGPNGSGGPRSDDPHASSGGF